MVNLAKFVVLTSFFMDWLSRQGGGLLEFAHVPRYSKLERFGHGFLLGLAVEGLAFLGLSLAGIFYPPVILGTSILLGVATKTTWKGSSLFLDAIREARVFGRWKLICTLAIAMPGILFLMVPIGYRDAYLHHLGLTWQYLQVHKALISQVSVTFHFPAPVEMNYAICHIIGDARVAGWIAFGGFLAGLGVLAGWGWRTWSVNGAWLGILLVITADVQTLFVSDGKSDIAASGLLAAGFLLTIAESWIPGALFLGLAFSAKLVYGPLVLVILFFYPPPVRRWFWCSIMLLVPVLPWWIKNYMATGNPFFPFVSSIIPTFDWGKANRGAFMFHQMNLWPAGTDNWRTLLSAWFNNMPVAFPAIILSVPLLLFLRKWRKVVSCLLIGQIIILATGHLVRYCLPTIWLLGMLAGEAMVAIPSIGGAISFVIACTGFAHSWVSFSSQAPMLRWRGLFMPYKEAEKISLSTLNDAAMILDSFGQKRVLSIGEPLEGRLSGRLIYGGLDGEMPVIWKSAKEAVDARDMAKKIKQTGSTIIVYNFVWKELGLFYYCNYFPFDKRMFKIAKEYSLNCLEFSGQTDRIDYAFGGYTFYRIRRNPVKVRNRFIPSIPGAEAVIIPARKMASNGNINGALQEFSRLEKENPEVMIYQAEQAYLYYQQGKYENAYWAARRTALSGIHDLNSRPIYAISAALTGRTQEAYGCLKDGIGCNWEWDNLVALTLSRICLGRAINAYKAGYYSAANIQLDDIADALKTMHAVKDSSEVHLLSGIEALTLGLRGDLMSVQGVCDKAVSCYRTAALKVPGSAAGIEWSQRANKQCFKSARPIPFGSID